MLSYFGDFVSFFRCFSEKEDVYLPGQSLGVIIGYGIIVCSLCQPHI